VRYTLVNHMMSIQVDQKHSKEGGKSQTWDKFDLRQWDGKYKGKFYCKYYAYR